MLYCHSEQASLPAVQTSKTNSWESRAFFYFFFKSILPAPLCKPSAAKHPAGPHIHPTLPPAGPLLKLPNPHPAHPDNRNETVLVLPTVAELDEWLISLHIYLSYIWEIKSIPKRLNLWAFKRSSRKSEAEPVKVHTYCLASTDGLPAFYDSYAISIRTKTEFYKTLVDDELKIINREQLTMETACKSF